MIQASDQKVALITGGGRGIGRAISKRLARDGFIVVVNYLTRVADAEETCRQIQSEGGTAWCEQADVTRQEDVRTLFNGIRGRHGRLDVLVNNAGSTYEGLFALTPESKFRDLFEKNVISVVLCSKAAIQMMLPKRKGSIVNLSSTATRGAAGLSAYAASKAAVDTLTRGLARELAKAGIRINAVAPSWVDTEMLSSSSASGLEELRKRTAVERFATTDEVAAVVASLVKDDMTYLSGQVIAVNGGGIS